jgi:hypothetical protein
MIRGFFGGKIKKKLKIFFFALFFDLNLAAHPKTVTG